MPTSDIDAMASLLYPLIHDSLHKTKEEWRIAVEDGTTDMPLCECISSDLAHLWAVSEATMVDRVKDATLKALQGAPLDDAIRKEIWERIGIVLRARASTPPAPPPQHN